MKNLLLAVSALTLVACGGHDGHNSNDRAEHNKDGHHTMETSIEASPIEITSAYVQPPFPGRDVAAGFFKLTNKSTDDRLIAVSSPVSESVEIHNHIEEDGVMKMRKINGVALPAGATVEFKPGSFHIMMFGAEIPEDAKDVTITLTYEKADPVTLTVPLGEPKATSGHSGH